MNNPFKTDIQAETLQFITRNLREPAPPPLAPLVPRVVSVTSSVSVPDAAVTDPPGPWTVQSVNADETLVTSPDQSAGFRTVVLVSVTYVNTATGETQTVPLVPGS